jgi:integrase
LHGTCRGGEGNQPITRASHSSEPLDIGIPLPAVSARLGHSSVRVTADIYSHAIQSQDDEPHPISDYDLWLMEG